MDKLQNSIIAVIIMIMGFTTDTQGINSYVENNKYEKEYEISNIREIDLLLACEVRLTQGDTESLRITADKDIFDRLTVNQEDSTLFIKTDRDKYDNDKWKVKVYLNINELRNIKIGGAVKLDNENILKSPKLTLDISGAADIDMDIEVEKLLADFSGAVNAEIKGKADYVVMDMSGASNVDTEYLKSRAFYLDFSGFGKAEIFASEVVKIDMSGMGVIRYSGDPEKVQTNSSGLGIIKPR
ncbi:MAG: head GIN domain-containing protein [Bacteroidales bacterium]